MHVLWHGLDDYGAAVAGGGDAGVHSRHRNSRAIEDRLLASRFGDRFRGYQHAKCQRTFPFSVGRVEKLR